MLELKKKLGISVLSVLDNMLIPSLLLSVSSSSFLFPYAEVAKKDCKRAVADYVHKCIQRVAARYEGYYEYGSGKCECCNRLCDNLICLYQLCRHKS